MASIATSVKNATDLIWTNGNSVSNFSNHDAFDFPNLSGAAPNGQTNTTNLNALRNEIVQALAKASDNTNSLYFNSVAVGALSAPPAVAINGFESSSGSLITSMAPGDTVTITGSGFDPNGDDIYIENANDPGVYYDFFDYAPNASGGVTFTLPQYYDLSDSGGAPDTVPGTYSVQVAGINSDWSNVGTITITSTANTPPVPTGVAPDTTTPNQFIMAGSGFSTTGNSIGLTPMTSSNLSSPASNTASAWEAFIQVIKDFFLPKKVSAQTAASPSYIIPGLSSNGSSVTFPVPSNVPNGTYTVSVRSLNTAWVKTTYKITVNNVVTTPVTPPTTPPVTPPTTPPVTPPTTPPTTSTGTPTYSCSSGYTLTGTSCYKSSTTIYIQASSYSAFGTCPTGYIDDFSQPGMCMGGTGISFTGHLDVSKTYSCPSGGTLSGTTCNVPAQTVNVPASTVAAKVSCSSGYVLKSTSCVPIPTSAASASLPNLTATPASTHSVSLSWTDGDVGITGYTISNVGGATETTVKTLTGSKTTSYKVTGLSANTEYCYAVRASFGSVSSYDSTMACAWTPPDNTISVSITKISTGSGIVTGNGIKCGASGTICSVAISPTTKLSLKASPTSGSAFYGWDGFCSSFGLTATCTFPANLLTDYNYNDSGIVPSITATFGPSAPKSLKASASVQGQISLSWNNNGVTNISGISVERSTAKSSGYAQIGIATSTSYIDTGLPSSTAYYYQIRMLFNSGTYGPYTDAVKATVDKPSTPSLKATATTSSVVGLSWSDSDAGVISYNVQETSPTPISIATVPYPTKSYVVTGLQPSTKYCFTVSAYVNPADSSAASTAKCVTTKAGTAVSNAAAMPLSVPVSVPTVTPSPVTVSTTTAPAVTQPAITQPAITQPTVTPATVVPPATTAPTPIPVPVTIPATVTYTCNNGYTLVANMCVGKTVRSRVAPFIAPRATYSCPSGYVLDASNNTCSKQISMDIATSSSTASVWDAIIDWFSGWFK
jgi:hypothetical protein